MMFLLKLPLLLLLSFKDSITFQTNQGSSETSCVLEFKQSPKTTVIRSATNQFLHCQAYCVEYSTCDVVVHYQWLFNGDIIRNTSSYKLHINGTLELTSFNSVGLYQCLASNQAGTIASSLVRIEWPRIEWDTGQNEISKSLHIKDGSYLYVTLPAYTSFPSNEVRVDWKCRENNESLWNMLSSNMTTLQGALYRHILMSRDNVTECKATVINLISMTTISLKVNINVTDIINMNEHSRNDTCTNALSVYYFFPSRMMIFEGDDINIEAVDQITQCRFSLSQSWKLNGDVVSEWRRLSLKNVTNQQSGYYAYNKKITGKTFRTRSYRLRVYRNLLFILI